jgi:hypothetical protein
LTQGTLRAWEFFSASFAVSAFNVISSHDFEADRHGPAEARHEGLVGQIGRVWRVGREAGLKQAGLNS